MTAAWITLGILIGVALALLGGWLVAGYHLWRRRNERKHWPDRECPIDCECWL